MFGSTGLCSLRQDGEGGSSQLTFVLRVAGEKGEGRERRRGKGREWKEVELKSYEYEVRAA